MENFDWTQIIVTIITICVPAFVTLFSGMRTRKQANRNAARSSILTMILDDRIRMMRNEVPENYHAIHDEYDVYSENGGNSWLHQKIDEYDRTVDSFERAIKK